MFKRGAGSAPVASDQTAQALNPAVSVNRMAASKQRMLFAGIAGIAILAGGYWIFMRSESARLPVAADGGLQPGMKMSDTVNRTLTEGEWIARSETELRDMQSRLALLEKTSTSVSTGTAAETQRLRREMERDRQDGRRVMQAYEEENGRLRRELQSRGGQGGSVPTPRTPTPSRDAPIQAAGPDPFRVQGGASPGASAPLLGSAAGAAMGPGIAEVKTISFTPVEKQASGPGSAPTGFQGRSPEAPPTAIEASPDYLPPNSYAPATVIVGVDASTGVSSQTDPLPVLLRITGPARSVVSNGRLLTTRLEGCVVNGAARGDLSSEKVYVKLVRMTCDQPGGRVAVSDVKGFISFAGKTGVRGRVVSREGDLLTKAFIAGIAGGFGRGFSANSQAALRPGATVVTGGDGNASVPQLSASQIVTGGLGEGVASSGDMLSQYLIERAEQYQPVVEMPTGIEVHIVFLDGVYVRGARQ
jgi:conjugal transfer pilus assembly protein TraB